MGFWGGGGVLRGAFVQALFAVLLDGPLVIVDFHDRDVQPFPFFQLFDHPLVHEGQLVFGISFQGGVKGVDGFLPLAACHSSRMR